MDILIYSCLVAWLAFIARLEEKYVQPMISKREKIDNEKLNSLVSCNPQVRGANKENQAISKTDLSILRFVKKELLSVYIGRVYKKVKGIETRTDERFIKLLIRLYKLGYIGSIRSTVVLTQLGEHALKISEKQPLPSQAKRGSIAMIETSRREAI